MRAILLATVALPFAFMSDVTETVTIKGADGKPLRVNKDDYDADQASDKPTMKLHKDDADQSAPAGAVTPLADGLSLPPAPSAPDFKGLKEGGDVQVPNPPVDDKTGAVTPETASPGQLLVSPEGNGAKKKFFVVDTGGVKVADKPGIDANGYPTEQDAWNAILALPH